MIERREAVFCRDTFWKDTIRVSTNMVAEEFVAQGWRCAWVTAPVTLTRIVPPRGGSRRRLRLWRAGGELVDGVLQYAPAVPLTWSWRPFLRSPWLGRNALTFAAPSIGGVLRRHGFRPKSDLLWIGTLSMASAVKAIPARRSAYHAHDLFMDYPGAPPQLKALERWLIGRVDGVFATSMQTRDALVERYGVSEAKVHMLGHGVNLERYRESPEPAEMVQIPHPRAIIVGTLGYVDAALVKALFADRRDVHLVCIGPGGGHLAALGLPNVHLLGPRAHEDLPPYLMHADVGLILYPLQLAEDLKAGCSPMKLFEYAAAGLTVVGTWLPEYERTNAPVLAARDIDTLREKFNTALESSAERRQHMRSWAAVHSWQSKYRFVCERLGL